MERGGAETKGGRGGGGGGGGGVGNKICAPSQCSTCTYRFELYIVGFSIGVVTKSYKFYDH